MSGFRGGRKPARKTRRPSPRGAPGKQRDAAERDLKRIARHLKAAGFKAVIVDGEMRTDAPQEMVDMVLLGLEEEDGG